MNGFPLLRVFLAFSLLLFAQADAQTITATQRDSFTGNSASRATPGSEVTYSIGISNTGGVAANGLTLTNPTPANTTFVAGSLRTTCLALNDVYSALGNVSLTVPAGSGVLANDRDPDNTGPALTATPLLEHGTMAGGKVTLDADGGFTYQAKAGYTGVDTFSYTLNDNDGEGNTDIAIVTINVSGMIWFINENATTNGDGRLSSPFNNLASFQAINNNLGNNPGKGDSIFLYESGDEYTGGIVLLEGQRLIGQDASLSLASLAGVTPPSGSAALPGMNMTPSTTTRLSHASGVGVTLGLNSRIHGLTVGSGTGYAVVGVTFGTLSVSDVVINNAIGGGLSLNGGSFELNSAFTSITAAGGNQGVALNNVAGALILGSGALSGSASSTFSVNGESGNVTYSGSVSKTSGTGSAVSITNKTGGTVNLSGAISSTARSGVILTNNTSAIINFTGGLTVNSGTNAAFTATGSGTVNVTGATNTLTSTTGIALNVANVTIGASGLTFRSISANGATNGILLNSTGALGGLTVTGTGSTGSGGTIQNGSGHGISLNNCAKVSLSGMNLTNNLGSGLAGATINGFLLDLMTISGNGNDAATDESGVNLSEVTGTISSGSHPTGINNSTIRNNNEFEVQILNTSGNLTDFQFNNNTVSSNGLPINGNAVSPHGNLVNFLALGSATMTINATGGSFSGNWNPSNPPATITATGIQADHSGASGTMTANLSNLSFTNNNVAVSVSATNGGNLAFDLDGNTATGNRSHGLNLFLGANLSGTTVGTFRGNTIGTNGVAGSGSQVGIGLRVQNEGAANVTLLIDSNTIQETAELTSFQGINVNVGLAGTPTQGGTTNLTIIDNLIRNIRNSRAITIQDNQSVAPFPTLFANIKGNSLGGTIAGAGGDGSFIRLRKLNGTVRVTQAAATATALANELDDANGFNDPFKISASGGVTFSQGTPPQPLLFDPATDLPALVETRARVAPGYSSVEAMAVPSVVVSAAAPVSNFGPAATPTAVLDEESLSDLVEVAARRWRETGLSSEQEAALASLRFQLSDLGNRYLGQVSGDLVEISRAAAGVEWFIDPTPAEDSEFSGKEGTFVRSNAPGSPAEGRVDLLTTILHEMGHRLGLGDTYEVSDRERLMYGFLSKGERRLPLLGEAVGAIPGTYVEPRFLSAPVDIGTLPPGKSITVTFAVTINTTPANFISISSQGTVSGSNFTSVLSNDPDTGAANDATVTPIEQRPVVTNLTAVGFEDVPINFTAAPFTAAFSDPNSDTLKRIRITSLSANGTLRVGVTPVAVNDEILAANLGALNFLPNPDYSGSASLGYNASDGQDYAVNGALLNLTIVSVNDAPTLNAIPDPVAILEDAAEQTVNLSGIGEGGGEGAQVLTITATSDNPALIPNPVAVDSTEGNASGAVRYTPATNAFGSAIITVRVQDSGGTSNGGVDTIERTFTVVVRPVADTPSITNATTLPNTQSASGLVVSRNAVDGNEVTHYQITQVQNGTLFQNNGTTAIAANSFITHAEASAGLKFTPTVGFQGDATFQVRASTSNVVGGLGGDAVSATISVSERVSIDTLNPGDNDAAESGNTGVFTFTRGGSAGTLVANFVLDPSSTATSADFTLSGSSVTYNSGTGTGTVTFLNGLTTAQVTLTAVTEALNAAEAAETVRFNLVPVALPAPGAYLAATPDHAVVTIAQNGFVVTTTNDSGTGSLRQAILNANGLAGADTITFSDGAEGSVNFTDSAAEVITLTSGELTISSELTLAGPGAAKLSLSGNNASRVVSVSGPGAILRGVTITGGASAGGGAIRNTGSLTLISVRVSENASSGASAALHHLGGTLNLLNSLVSGNTTVTGPSDGGAGAVRAETGALSIVNSTLSGNTVVGPGSAGHVGAVAAQNGATVTILNATITGNEATGTNPTGGLLAASGTFSVGNSIIAGNTTAPDVRDTFTSLGSNLIGDRGPATGFVDGVKGDQVGSSGFPLNPGLAPLSNNGGPTPSHALLAGSSALNAGDAALLPLDTFDLDGDLNRTEVLEVDQRGDGFFRVIGALDIGAFELQKSVSITALDAVKVEGSGSGTTNYTFTVARTGDLNDAVTLNWTAIGSGTTPANAADFVTTSGQVVLNPTEASATINVPVKADTIVEAAEGFSVTLSNASNGYVISGASAEGTINNDDSAVITLTGGTAMNEGNTGTTTYIFMATLSQPVQGGVSIAYATGDGTAMTSDADYEAKGGSLSFTGAAAGETLTISVLANGDNKVEADETFTVALGAISGGHGSVAAAGSPQIGTIINDDSASISISDVSQPESAGAMLFEVTLTSPSDMPVTVAFATADNTAIAPGDYTSTTGTVTFPPNSSTTQTIPVMITADGNFESDESFFVNLSNLGAAGRSVTLADAQGIGTIENTDILLLSLSAIDDSADENSAGVDPGIWRLSRNGTLGEVTVNLEVDLSSTATAADWIQSGASFVSTEPGAIGTATIPDGQAFVDLVLTVVDDLHAESDETVQLNVTAGAGYTPINAPARTVTIVRNDFGVTQVGDSGEGSLRQAVENANVLGGDPTITFEGALFNDVTPDTITLGGTQLDLLMPMTLNGPGANLLTISGNNTSRLFEIQADGGVMIRGMKLTAGYAAGTPSGQGGAIAQYNADAVLTLEACHLTGNTADAFGGGLMIDSGTAVIRDCTISNNTANSSGTGGGGIVNNGNLTLLNSTVSGNQAPNASTAGGGGGGIITFGTLVIENSTVTGNRASVEGGGGGIDVKGSVSMKNTIVAGNFAGPGTTSSDLAGFPLAGGTYNLIGDAASAGGLVDGTNGNLVGNAGAGTLVISTVLDPVLTENGGRTPTHKLVIGSPAIDAADPAFDGSTFTPALTNDQRAGGFARVTKGLASSAMALLDIGAYELIAAPVFSEDDLEIHTGSGPLDLTTASGVTPPGGVFSGTGVTGGFFDPTGLNLGAYPISYTVTDSSGNSNRTDLTVTVTEVPSLTVTSTGDVVDKLDGFTSLREALAYAATLSGAQIVDFSDSSAGGATNFHDVAPDTIVLGGAALVIDGEITLLGPGSELLILDGDARSGIFSLPGTDPGDAMAVRDLTLCNGKASFGGAIFVGNGSLTVERCVILDNVAESGGGIGTLLGHLEVIDCLVIGNKSQTDSGGGFYLSGGSAQIVRTTVRGNESSVKGGAAFFSAVTAAIIESLLEDNLAEGDGGAVYLQTGGSLKVVNSTISGNTTASGRGGAIYSEASLTVTQSTLTGNATAQAGGGICAPAGTATVANTLIALNTASLLAPDVYGNFADAGSNLIGIADGSADFTVSALVGTSLAPLDPLLAPLGDYGGATFTHALLIGSPAIDAGDNLLAVDGAAALLATDQRGPGFARVVKGLSASTGSIVDIGAFEIFAAPTFGSNQLSVVTGGSPIDLAFESGVVTPGGTFSGPGVSAGLFDPGALAPGDYVVTYLVVDSFGVANTSNLTVTVKNLPASLEAERPSRFEPTQVGRKSRTQRIRLTNAGGLPVTGLKVRLRGPHRKDFRLVEPSLTTLAPAGSTVYRLTFKPRGDGVRKATITVTGLGEVATMPVKGIGLRSGPPPPLRYPSPPNQRKRDR